MMNLLKTKWFKPAVNFSLLRSGVILLGLLCGTPAIALPESVVIQKLENIPLFGFANEQGELNSYLFVDPQQAESALRALENSDPQRARELSLQPFPLSTIYQGLQALEDQNLQLPQLIIPDQESLDNATRLMRSNGQRVEDPQRLGIPLFVATIGSGNQERWLLVTNRQTNQPYIPFYLDKAEADRVLQLYKDRNPNETDPVQVRVYGLGYIVGLLLGNNNEAVRIMEIVPSTEQINRANQLLTDS